MYLNGFNFLKSNRKNKKYMVRIGNTTIHFGDNRYGQYFDKIGLYSHLNHLDPKRRKDYYSRHGKESVKYTPKYFSHNFLW